MHWLLLSLLHGSAPSLNTAHHLSGFCLGSCLQPHQARTPFSGLCSTVLYHSLAFFMSLSILVCDLITSESLMVALQGQEAKTVLHFLSSLACFISQRSRDLKSVYSTQTLQGYGKMVDVTVLGVTWSRGQLFCVPTSPGPRSSSSLLFSNQAAAAESHPLPSPSRASSALRHAFPTGLGDPEELASTSLPCSLGNVDSKDQRGGGAP